MTTIEQGCMESTCNGLLFVHVLCGAMCSRFYVCSHRYAIIILEFVVYH